MNYSDSIPWIVVCLNFYRLILNLLVMEFTIKKKKKPKQKLLEFSCHQLCRCHVELKCQSRTGALQIWVQLVSAGLAHGVCDCHVPRTPAPHLFRMALVRMALPWSTCSRVVSKRRITYLQGLLSVGENCYLISDTFCWSEQTTKSAQILEMGKCTCWWWRLQIYIVNSNEYREGKNCGHFCSLQQCVTIECSHSHYPLWSPQITQRSEKYKY